ncbi:hypothetical protein TYRP_015869 [Tyrophagus putrescentiae]|nr:hypothetical protein TYRP_015869 [Tyrophagus putrescentiae]
MASSRWSGWAERTGCRRHLLLTTASLTRLTASCTKAVCWAGHSWEGQRARGTAPSRRSGEQSRPDRLSSSEEK